MPPRRASRGARACALLAASAAVSLGAAAQPDPVLVSGPGTGAEPRISIDNGLLALVLEPGHGGRIAHFIDRRHGLDSVVPGQGWLLDMFMHQDYPGELARQPYRHELLEAGPDRVAVRLWRQADDAPVRGVVVEKTVRLERGWRHVDVTYRFANTAAQYRSFSFWAQQFCGAGPDAGHDLYLRPGARGMSAVPFPGGAGAPDVLEEPGAGWTAVLDPQCRAGTAFLVDYDRLRWLYNAFAAQTVEWFSDQVLLAPGGAWETRVRIVPLHGWSGLDMATDELLVHTAPARREGRLRLTHRLAASDGVERDWAVVATALVPGRPGPASIARAPAARVGAEPVELVQVLVLDAGAEQVLLEVSLESAGVATRRFWLNLADGAGRVDRAAALRQRPPKATSFPPRPADFAIRRDASLDVLVLAGPGFARFRLDRLREIEPGSNLRWSWYTHRVIMNARTEGVAYFPCGYDELASFDAIVFAGLGPFVLEDVGLHMLKDFLAVGGRVLVLGGTTALHGWSGPAHPLGPLFPVVDPRPFAIRALPPDAAIRPAVPRAAAWLGSEAPPTVGYAHQVQASAEATVWLDTALGPLLLQRPVGMGSLWVFLGTAMGPDAPDRFWHQPFWPRLLHAVLSGESN